MMEGAGTSVDEAKLGRLAWLSREDTAPDGGQLG